ncbi:hypothetical protein CBR_g3044 [Chara braunii]|uniref:Retrotransposon gag domain-containing protein n=1 Tax=Chara braunii TaxID=69332 RepID=A0A388KEM0_CHABU|nr:hypothetical protein CBR_g3044 [Chara braunii]|eukprot:GBG68500.1 hypothetical protein CBR_g3044 [Chara braunii]
MPEGGKAGKVLTLEDLIAALDRHEKTPSNVPRVETFHFDGERVSDWLYLVEQAMVGLSDEVKFQRIMRYVLHRHHQEVQKVLDAAHGSWARFRENMLRKYRLGDGLLTIQDLEGMNKDDFTTIGAFVQEFKKKARKVYGISEERQCAIFLGLLTGSEAAELISHGGGSAKLTWATIDRGVEDGSLDQVKQHQMRLQRRKRKERDVTASGTPGVKRIITDVLAALGYGQDAEAQRKAVAVVQGRGKKVGDEGAGQEDYGLTFYKAVMEKGGRGTRPRQRPLGASGGGEQRGPFRRELTPVFDDDNIELFLDAYREHATRRGWDVSERREATRQWARETGQAIEGADEAIEVGELGFAATRRATEWVDKEIKQTSIETFQRYSLLSDELALRKDEVEQLTAQLTEERAENKARQARLEAKEAEWEAKLKEMAAAVEKLTATKVIDWAEQSRYDIQGKEVQGLFGQEEAAEASRQEKLGKVFLNPAEA